MGLSKEWEVWAVGELAMKRCHTSKMQGKAGSDDPELSIAPLIDVSFLLLIFFIVTTTIMRKERDLGMMIPVDGEGEIPPMSIVVGVEDDGRILLNPGIGELLISSDLDQRELTVLENHVAMIRSVAAERDVVVQLRVEEEARQQRVVDVLNCFAKMGVTTVALVD